MKKLAVSFSNNLFDNLIVLLFSVLPLVDSVNGFLVRQGGPSVASIYKVMLCAILLLPVLRAQRVRSKALAPLLALCLYAVFSVGVNLFLFKEKNLQTDFVIKLLFNAVTLALLIENHSNGTLTASSFYRMLNISAWLLPACFLIPYVLGLGNTVYGNMGYKAFFIAQNELSLIIIVLFFFCLYKLTLKFRFSWLVQAGLILLCGLLLNTKSTILACLLGAGVYYIYVLIKMPTKIRLYAIAIMVFACLLFIDVIVDVCTAMIERFVSLQTKHYGGSLLTAILSGRDYLLENAWTALTKEHFLFRFFFGNGFCSDILVEMDIVDIFFYLGFFGAAGAVAFLAGVFLKSRKNLRSDPTCMRSLSFWLIIVFLNITGHVLFMAMSGCYFVLYLCFLLTFRAADLPAVVRS